MAPLAQSPVPVSSENRPITPCSLLPKSSRTSSVSAFSPLRMSILSHSESVKPNCAPLALASVCRYWRAVALSTRELWVSVSFPICSPGSISLSQAWLARSGNLLLSSDDVLRPSCLDHRHMGYDQEFVSSCRQMTASGIRDSPLPWCGFLPNIGCIPALEVRHCKHEQRRAS